MQNTNNVHAFFKTDAERKRLIKVFFGKDRELFNNVSHFIAPYEELLFESIKEVSGISVGVWQEFLYVPFNNSFEYTEDTPENYKYWTEDINQKEIYDFCSGKRGSAGATVFLSSLLPVNILQNLEEARLRCNTHLDDIEFVRDFFIQHLKEVGWVCLALDLDLHDFILVMFDESAKTLFDNVRQCLTNKGVKSFTIRDISSGPKEADDK